MRVLLAEKPSVAGDLAATLGATAKRNGFYEGNNNVVTWAFGHLLTAADPETINPAWGGEWTFDQLPMLPDQLAYRVEGDKKTQFNIIRDLFCRGDVDEIVCCTDAGREGELIFRLIYEHTGTKRRFSRLWTSSLTPQAIKQSFEKRQPGQRYDNLGSAAKARALADWIFGMNLTRAYTVLNGSLYPVGRVKTPTMAMIVERDREIDAFKSQPFYEIVVTYKDGFTGKYTYSDQDELTTRLSDQNLATQIAAEIRAAGAGRVSRVDIQKKTSPPPPLYSLLTLQKDANAKHGFTAAETLELAQALYETHHVLTYPRTEATHLPTDMVPELGPTLRSLPSRYQKQAETALAHLNSHAPGKQHIDDAKLTDHHAIIPALNTKADAVQLSEKEAKVYELVVTRFLAMFFPDHVFNAITIDTLFGKHLVVSRGKQILTMGWRELYAGASNEDDEQPTEAADENQVLPAITQGQNLPATSVDRKDGKTTPPKHYTDATLLTAMKRAGSRVQDETLAAFIKHAGIGTPATRAQIIEDLIHNHLIERKKKQLIATSSAHSLYDQVVPELRDPTTTAEWEQQLSDIEAGTKPSHEFTSKLRVFLQQTIVQVKNSEPITEEGLGTCPACKSGQIRAVKGFYGCSRYREGCTFTLPGVWCKKKLPQKAILELLGKNRKTSLIKGFTSTKKAGVKYDAYLELDEQNKIRMSFPPR